MPIEIPIWLLWAGAGFLYVFVIGVAYFFLSLDGDDDGMNAWGAFLWPVTLVFLAIFAIGLGGHELMKKLFGKEEPEKEAEE